jgi:hypothetical protein
MIGMMMELQGTVEEVLNRKDLISKHRDLMPFYLTNPWNTQNTATRG